MTALRFFLRETIFAFNHDSLKRCMPMFYLSGWGGTTSKHYPSLNKILTTPNRANYGSHAVHLVIARRRESAGLDSVITVVQLMRTLQMIHYSDVDGPRKICRCQPVGPADMNVSPSCVSQESQSHLCRLPLGFWCRNRISWCFWLTAAVLLAGLVSRKNKKIKTLQAMCAVQCGSSITQYDYTLHIR